MTRMALATVVIAAMTVGAGVARPAAASSRASNSTDQATVVGCVAQVADGFLLRARASSSGSERRSGGSNSAKGSTPIGGGDNTIVRKAAAGSSSPKGSTPIRTASAEATGRRTSSVLTSKGSVSIARSAVADVTYVTYGLDADSDLISTHADHFVEIRGRLVATPPNGSARRLKVEHVKMVSSTCAP